MSEVSTKDAAACQLEDFDYALPPEQIAQQPAQRRDEARLMVMDRNAVREAVPRLGDHRVSDLPGLLPQQCRLAVLSTLLSTAGVTSQLVITVRQTHPDAPLSPRTRRMRTGARSPSAPR